MEQDPEIHQNPETAIRDIVYSCVLDHLGTTVKVSGLTIAESPLPPVIIVHDIGESRKQYRHLMETLAKQGHSTYTYEIRGLWQPKQKTEKGAPQRIESFNRLVKDLLQVVALIRSKERREPVILGRGLGALIGLSLTKAHGRFTAGFIFSSPMFELSYNLTPFRRFCIATLSEFLPSVRLPRWLTPRFTSSEDPFEDRESKRHTVKLSSSFTFELLNAISQSKKLLSRLSAPSLFLCPESDPALRYRFLRPLLQKNQHAHKFAVRMIGGNGGVENESGSKYVKYLSHAILSWLDEYHSADLTTADEPASTNV